MRFERDVPFVLMACLRVVLVSAVLVHVSAGAAGLARAEEALGGAQAKDNEAAANSAEPAAKTAEPAAPPVVVIGRTDRERVSIGTPFRYTVEVRAEKDVELVVPVLGGQLGEFTVTDFGEEPVTEADGRVIITRWYTLVTYTPGYLFIPGMTVQYRIGGEELKRVDGKDVGIRVASLLEQEPDAKDIRDIKGPVAVPFDWTPVIIGIAILAGVIALGLIASRLLRRINAPSAATPPPPPDVVALEALARLRHRRLTEPEERAAWYVDLSAIVRTYIEGRFGLRAPEMTTEEFIHAVQLDSPLIPEHRQLLGEFLAECDLVKFARYMPTMEETERVYAAARRFINESRPESVEKETRRAA
jgi:hypothetical protein